MTNAASAEPLLSRPEQILYGRLVRAFPGHVILSQVALSRLFAAARGHDAAQRRAAPAALRDSVASFVVCKADFSAIAVVEPPRAVPSQDMARVTRTHSRQDALLRALGIKVVRLTGEEIPAEPALKALVSALPLHSSTAQLLRRAS